MTPQERNGAAGARREQAESPPPCSRVASGAPLPHRKWELLTDGELRRAFAAAYGPRTVVQTCPASCFWPHNVVASRVGNRPPSPAIKLAASSFTWMSSARAASTCCANCRVPPHPRSLLWRHRGAGSLRDRLHARRHSAHERARAATGRVGTLGTLQMNEGHQLSPAPPASWILVRR